MLSCEINPASYGRYVVKDPPIGRICNPAEHTESSGGKNALVDADRFVAASPTAITN